MIPLRKYQQEAIDACVAALEDGKRRLVINLPTGTGKTITALTMVARSLRRGNRVLWIAHRDELISQTAESFYHVAPDLAAPGVVKAAQNDFGSQFVIASIQTLWGKDRSVEKKRTELQQRLEEAVDRADESGGDGGEIAEVTAIEEALNELEAASYPRWEAMQPQTFGMVVYDECHHSVSPAAITLMKTVKPESLLLGLSATPYRGDNATLAQIFTDGIVYQLPLKQAIREGYLSDFKYQSVWLDLDLSQIKTTAGDYNAKQLESALAKAGVVEVTAQGIAKHAADRKGIIFTFTKVQAEETARALIGLGINADFVSDDTSKDERRKILKALKTGEISYVANCAVLTEGYDEPSVNCVVIARPTKSKPLYTQMAGRGLRLFKDKTDCLLLDFVGVGKKNPPAGVVDLIGVIPDPGKTSEETEKRIVEEEDAKGLPKDPVAKAMLDAADKARKERDSWKAAWVVIKHKVAGVVEARVLPGRAKRKCIIFNCGDDTWKVAAWLPSSNGVYYIEQRGISLEFAESIARQAMRDMGQRGIFDSSAMWRIRPPTGAALGFAKKCGIEVGGDWNGGEVADAINSITAGWDLKSFLIKGTQKRLSFDTPEAFREALKREREASENEYEDKKEERRQATEQTT